MTPERLQKLRDALEGDIPVIVVDQSMPSGGSWWSFESLPFVHVNPDYFFNVHSFFMMAFGECGVLVEGDA